MTIHEKLSAIQSKLHAPKSQRNTFGQYNYRNCEDILEAVKPLLIEQKCTLSLSDSIEMIGSRFYVKAEATLSSTEEAAPPFVQIAVTAYAREEETKKGMDGAQITGAASSYARKYALNGLFCIDDTKDADSMENEKESPQKAPAAKQAPKAATPPANAPTAPPKVSTKAPATKPTVTKVMEAMTDSKTVKNLDIIHERALKYTWDEKEAATIQECYENTKKKLNPPEPTEEEIAEAERQGMQAA